MDRSVIQGVFGIRHAKEPGALDECCGAEAGNFQQFFPAREAPVGISPRNDIFGDGSLDSSDMAQ